MAIIREEHQSNYTVIQNDILNNPKMSLKSKALLCFMLSKPNGWDFSVNGLKSQLKEGRDSISNSLIELEKFNYLFRHQVKDENNRFVRIDYYVYETPTTKKPFADFPITEKPNTGNHEQVNTILSKESIKVNTKQERKNKKESFDFKSVSGLNYEYWQIWKDFKKEQFNFIYKEIGEKMAIAELLKISNGNTSKQKDIIIQSVKNGYKGLFELKENKEQSETQKKTFEDGVKERYEKRFGKPYEY